MGACEFTASAIGRNAEEAFRNAVEEAEYEYGHGGYTGSIAEKNSFEVIPDDRKVIRQRIKDEITQLKAELKDVKANRLLSATARNALITHIRIAILREKVRLELFRGRAKENDYEIIASYLIEKDDNRISDKRGPAGCILTKEKTGIRGRKKYFFFGFASS